MDRGEYCGPIKALLGKTALIQPDETYNNPLETRTLVAQFDEMWIKHPETGAILSHHWNTFPAADFKILVPVKW